MNVRLVGCGFLGSLFAEELAKWCFALKQQVTFQLFDDDKVDERNVANQLYRPTSIGRSKAEVLSRLLEEYRFEAAPRKVRVDEGVHKAVVEPGADVLVCAVDNIETRQLMWSRSLAKSVPLLNMGISQGGTGSVDWTYMEGGVDTNPFGLTQGHTEEQLKAYAQLNKQLPPCELIGFRGLGLNMALASTKALMILYGHDPDRIVHKRKGEIGPWGSFTTWLANPMSHSLSQTFQVEDNRE